MQSCIEIIIDCIKNGFQKAIIHSYDDLMYEETPMEVQKQNISIPDQLCQLLNTIDIHSDHSDIEGLNFS